MSAVTEQIVEKNAFKGADPLTRLFQRRLEISPWVIAVGWFIFVQGVIAVLATINQFWLSQPGHYGLLSDITWWVWQLFVVPLTIFYFFWMPTGIQRTLGKLWNNHIIVPNEPDTRSENSFISFVGQFDGSYSHWFWALVSAIGVLLYMFIIVIPDHRTYVSWSTTGNLVFWFTEFHWLVVFYVIMLMVGRMALVLYWFNRLFKEFRVDVKVFHPDNAGGLSPMSEFSVRMGYLITVYGFSAVFSMFVATFARTGQFSGITFSYMVLFTIGLYIVLAPVLFFAPLGAAHSAMKQARDELILKIANQFEEEQSQLEAMLEYDADKLDLSIRKLEQLQKLHKMAASFPVWPFNMTNLVRFFSTTLSPIIIGLIPTIIELFRS